MKSTNLGSQIRVTELSKVTTPISSFEPRLAGSAAISWKKDWMPWFSWSMLGPAMELEVSRTRATQHFCA